MRTTRPAASMLMPSFNPGNDWTINVPLTDLVALQELPNRIKEYEEQNLQLRKELEALRILYSQLLQTVADLRRELKAG